MTQNTNEGLRVRVWAKTDGRCWYCGGQLHNAPEFQDDGYMHIEHQDPRATGGKSNLGNLVPACRTCNLRKRHKNVEQFRRYMRFVNAGIEPMTNAQIDWCMDNGLDVMATLPGLEFYGEVVE
jgi:5-methylcytosine-specific restriction endonuclease McrA